jgi:hypothetical protein
LAASFKIVKQEKVWIEGTHLYQLVNWTIIVFAIHANNYAFPYVVAKESWETALPLLALPVR